MANGNGQDIVEQVKKHNRIEAIIEADGYTLVGRGRYRRARSHDSLIVDVHNQSYHWNSRDEHGDVISWVQARLSTDFKTAIEDLCRRASMPMPRWGQEDQTVRIAARKREDAFTVAMRVFAGWLWQDPEALGYARSRGWTDEVIRGAMLGYTGTAERRQALVDALKQELLAAGVDVEIKL